MTAMALSTCRAKLSVSFKYWTNISCFFSSLSVSSTSPSLSFCGGVGWSVAPISEACSSSGPVSKEKLSELQGYTCASRLSALTRILTECKFSNMLTFEKWSQCAHQSVCIQIGQSREERRLWVKSVGLHTQPHCLPIQKKQHHAFNVHKNNAVIWNKQDQDFVCK